MLFFCVGSYEWTVAFGLPKSSDLSYSEIVKDFLRKGVGDLVFSEFNVRADRHLI